MKSLFWGLIIALFSTRGFAAWSVPSDKCYWYNNAAVNKYFQESIALSRQWGTASVTRSLTVGGEVNSETQMKDGDLKGYIGVSCGSSAVVTARITSASSPVAISVPGYPGSEGKVYSTNIPGVGMIARMKHPNANENVYFPLSFSPDSSLYYISGLPVGVTLVKTGEIPPGTHVVSGSISLAAGGYTFETGSFAYTIFVESCSIPNKGATSRVLMDEISIIDLNPGGPLRPFQIPLTDCATGAASKNIAKVLFNGTSGSSNLDAGNGILGLDSSSKSSGIGIQILKQDGVTPFPLGTATEAGKITSGETLLNFNARYIKTNNNPQPGSANAKANFTVSYN